MNKVLTNEQVKQAIGYITERTDRWFPHTRVSNMDYMQVGEIDGYLLVKGWLESATNDFEYVGEYNLGELKAFCEGKKPFESHNDNMKDYRYGFIRGYEEACHFVEWMVASMGHEEAEGE